jgi:hypothetical protein
LQEFGAGSIWIIDPETLEAEIHTLTHRINIDDGVMRLQGTNFEVPLHALADD